MDPITPLDARHDAMGAAIDEYQRTGRASRLCVRSSMFDDDEIPVHHLFRGYDAMPELERRAIDLTVSRHASAGRVLDVGAGAGCHSLVLQDRGIDITAIDISPLSCEAMKRRGVQHVQCIDFFDPRLTGPFDTILMLMNGTGIVGRLCRMPDFFQRLRLLLSPSGQLLIDSSDLRYLYENEDGSYDIDPLGPYYGEVDYQMVYRRVQGKPFDWLYVDFQTLLMLAQANGFACELVAEGPHYDYLAKISIPSSPQ